MTRITALCAALVLLSAALLGAASPANAGEVRRTANPIVQSVTAAGQSATVSAQYTATSTDYWTVQNVAGSYVRNNGTRTIWVLIRPEPNGGAGTYLGAIGGGATKYLPYPFSGYAHAYLRYEVVRQRAGSTATCTALVWIAPLAADQTNAQSCS